MAAGQGADAYIELADFTGGIAATYASGGKAQMVREDPENPRVYAQRDYTAGCYGHPLGGLYPLPGIRDEVVEDLDDWNTEDGYPTGFRSLVVNATGIISPLDGVHWMISDSVDQNDQPHPHTPDQLAILYGGWYESSTVPGLFGGSQELRVFTMGPGPRAMTDLLGGFNEDSGSDFHRFMNVRGTINTNNVTVTDNTIGAAISRGMGPAHIFPVTTGTWYKAGAADETFWPVAPSDQTGSVKEMGRVGFAIVADSVGIYPDLLASDEGQWSSDPMVRVLSGLTGVYLGLMHQNQIVFARDHDIQTGLRQPAGQHGTLGEQDYIGWFQPNDLANDASRDQFRFMPESPSAYGAAVVVNANELFMVKHVGGALVVRGDVGNPQVINLTGVPATHGATNVPVITPLGVVYGTRDGVWLWTGGEDAEPLSPLLDGCFWLPEDQPSLDWGHPSTVRGKFNYSHPFVYAPNNWILDLRTRAWFRLAFPIEAGVDGMRYYRNYEVSSTGRVYAVKSWVHENDVVVAHLFDPQTPTRKFWFRSHPIRRTINRQLKFREVVVEAQGRGTITVNLYGVGSGPGGPASATFTIKSADRPVTLRKEVSAEFANVEVEIISTSVEDGLPPPSTTTDGVTEGSAEYPAPIVHRVSLGYRGDRSVQRGD